MLGAMSVLQRSEQFHRSDANPAEAHQSWGKREIEG